MKKFTAKQDFQKNSQSESESESKTKNDDATKTKRSFVRPRRQCHSLYSAQTMSTNNVHANARSDTMEAERDFESSRVRQSSIVSTISSKSKSTSLTLPITTVPSVSVCEPFSASSIHHSTKPEFSSLSVNVNTNVNMKNRLIDECDSSNSMYISNSCIDEIPSCDSSLYAANEKTKPNEFVSIKTNKSQTSFSQSQSQDDGFLTRFCYQWCADSKPPVSLIQSAKFIGGYGVHLSEHFDEGWNCKKRGSAKKTALQFSVNGEIVSLVFKSISQKNFSNRLNIRPYQRASYVTIHLPEQSLSCVFFAVEQPKPNQGYNFQQQNLVNQLFELSVKPNLVGVNPTDDRKIPLLMLNSGKDVSGATTVLAFFSHSNDVTNVDVHAVRIDNHVVDIRLQELNNQNHDEKHDHNHLITRTVTAKPAAIVTNNATIPLPSSMPNPSFAHSLQDDSSITSQHNLPNNKKRHYEESVHDDDDDEAQHNKSRRLEFPSSPPHSTPSSPSSPVSVTDIESLPEFLSDSETEDLASLPDSPKMSNSTMDLSSSLSSKNLQDMNATNSVNVDHRYLHAITELRHDALTQNEHEFKCDSLKSIEISESNRFPHLVAMHLPSPSVFTFNVNHQNHLPKSSPTLLSLDSSFHETDTSIQNHHDNDNVDEGSAAFLLPNNHTAMLQNPSDSSQSSHSHTLNGHSLDDYTSISDVGKDFHSMDDFENENDPSTGKSLINFPSQMEDSFDSNIHLFDACHEDAAQFFFNRCIQTNPVVSIDDDVRLDDLLGWSI